MASDTGTQRVSLAEKVGYGLGDAACNVVFQMVMSFMAYFYTDVFGLAPAAMGTMFLLVRGLSSVADPVMGILCDRTETRWGKFRPYLLWLCLPFGAIAVLAFVTPDFTPTGKLVYAYTTFALLMIVYSAVNVPYCALGAVLTADGRERVSLNGIRFLLATLGGTLVVAATLPLVRLLGAGNDRLGFPLAVALLAGLAIAMLVACFALTKERVRPADSNSSAIWHDIKFLLANDQWLVVAVINFVLFIAFAIQDGSAIYYLTWYVGRQDLTSAFLTTGMVSSMAGALVAAPLVAHIPKTKAYSLLQAAIVVASVALYCVAENQVALLFGLYALQQFITQMASPILWSMMADTADYGEFKTGRRMTGLTISGMLLALKLGAAVGGALLGWMLAYFNYQSGAATQSAGTITGIVTLFTLVPAAGHLLLILLMQRYRLTDDRCAEIQAELSRRQSMLDPPSTFPT